MFHINKCSFSCYVFDDIWTVHELKLQSSSRSNIDPSFRETPILGSDIYRGLNITFYRVVRFLWKSTHDYFETISQTRRDQLLIVLSISRSRPMQFLQRSRGYTFELDWIRVILFVYGGRMLA